MKKIWITSLVRDEKRVSGLLSTARKYGLDANGHFWTDDLKHMAWQAPMETICDPDAGLWVVLGSAKELETESVRYGLALLATAVQSRKGHGFHILWACPEGSLAAESLPTPFRGADIISAADSGIGAKLAAKANMPVAKMDPDYRLAVHANPGFGLWMEVGPGKGGQWRGAMLGAAGAAIDAHGVGPSGKLPQKAVLEYPVKGLKLSLGDTEYTGWAVQNRLDETLSYYARIQGVPKSLLFGEYAQDEEAEVHVLQF